MGSEAERLGRANYDLQVVRQIERVTRPGRNQRRHGPIDILRMIDIFFPDSDCFEHQVEIPGHRVARASAEIVIPQVAIVYVGEKKYSSIEVQRYAFTDNFTER